jgi:hypothetical protein
LLSSDSSYCQDKDVDPRQFTLEEHQPELQDETLGLLYENENNSIIRISSSGGDAAFQVQTISHVDSI